MFSPNKIDLKPSWKLTLLFSAMAGATEAALFLIDLPDLVFILISVLVLIYFIYTIGQYAWLSWPGSMKSMYTSLDSDGQLQIRIKPNKGEWRESKLQHDSLISPALTLLIVKAPRTRRILLTKDNCNPDQYRKFRVLARMTPLR